MKFNLTRPCKDCPFRTDCPTGWLGRSAERIAAELTREDKTFACHKTTGVETPWLAPPADDSQCAGALLMLQQANKLHDNWRFRLAQQMKILDMSKLKTNIPVFESPEAFVNHHKNSDMYSDNHSCRLTISLKKRDDPNFNIVKLQKSELDVAEVRKHLVDCAQEWAAGGPPAEPLSVEQLYDLLNKNWNEDLDLSEIGLELNVCGEHDPHYVDVYILAHD
jgi:hypothetical protein